MRGCYSRCDRMAAPQTTLDVTLKSEAQGVLLTACNQAIIDHLMMPGAWSSHACVLSGPAKSGKSTLAKQWQDLSSAHVAIELDEISDEEAVFHLFNSTKQEGKKLLIVSEKNVEQCNIALPDLSSRLKSAEQLSLPQPDDELATMLCAKLFSQRQLQVDEGVIDYCLKRIPRSFLAIHRLVDALDIHALTERRNITIPLAKEVLETTSWE